jgi:hypothetical protein
MVAIKKIKKKKKYKVLSHSTRYLKDPKSRIQQNKELSATIFYTVGNNFLNFLVNLAIITDIYTACYIVRDKIPSKKR